jgi:hypothetical protein
VLSIDVVTVREDVLASGSSTAGELTMLASPISTDAPSLTTWADLDLAVIHIGIEAHAPRFDDPAERRCRTT